MWYLHNTQSLKRRYRLGPTRYRRISKLRRDLIISQGAAAAAAAGVGVSDCNQEEVPAIESKGPPPQLAPGEHSERLYSRGIQAADLILEGRVNLPPRARFLQGRPFLSLPRPQERLYWVHGGFIHQFCEFYLFGFILLWIFIDFLIFFNFRYCLYRGFYWVATLFYIGPSAGNQVDLPIWIN